MAVTGMCGACRRIYGGRVIASDLRIPISCASPRVWRRRASGRGPQALGGPALGVRSNQAPWSSKRRSTKCRTPGIFSSPKRKRPIWRAHQCHKSMVRSDRQIRHSLSSRLNVLRNFLQGIGVLLRPRGESIMPRYSKSASDDVKGAMKRRKAGTLKRAAEAARP